MDRRRPPPPPPPPPLTALAESMRVMSLGRRLLEQPGVMDCAYYLRNGSCGYGDRCRYNHPPDRLAALAGVARGGVVEYPQRPGQLECQYFLKNGTCKFGLACKFDHPRQGDGSVQRVSVNYLGYPMRMGERECTYYMKTGQCKFGLACKFHHPQPAASMPLSPQAYYPLPQSTSVRPPYQYPSVNGTRPLASQYIQGPYGPMVVSPGMVPISGWTPYPAPVSSLASPTGQQNIRARSVYGSSQQLSPSAPAYHGADPRMYSVGSSSSISGKEHTYPERPGQPDCRFYMKTGDCKFGSECIYHHPRDRSIGETNCVLSPIGLPLRPEAPPCTFYVRQGVCKFGPTCKFDHPMGTLGYSAASSLADMQVTPYSGGFSKALLARPSSSSEPLRTEHLYNKNGLFTQIPSTSFQRHI